MHYFYSKSTCGRYPILVMILVGFFTALLAICFQWQIVAAGESTAEDNPGLDFVPRPDPANVNNTLIYYKSHDEASVLKWTSKIDEFLRQYSGSAPGVSAAKWMACSWDYSAVGDKVCAVDLREFGPCSVDNQYNYNRAAPCVFLKLDKILNWTPNPYNTSEDLPKDMPEDLKQHIREHSGKVEANIVWVTCEGENPADVEYMGPIQYFPFRGFPSYYFPVSEANKDEYLSPLVAVYFERPNNGVVINILCKAWARNIVRDQYEKRGSVHFELMVDP